MSSVRVHSGADRALTHILRQLCCALNPVKALRRRRQRNPPGAPPGLPSITTSGRAHLQSSISILDVAFSAAETIPVFGAPLKGALEALYKVLRLVEVSSLRTLPSFETGCSNHVWGVAKL